MKDGIVEVSLDVKGKGNDWHAWQINGWIALTDGLVTAPGLEHTLSNLYLRAKIIRTSAEIKRLAFKIQESDVAFPVRSRTGIAIHFLTWISNRRN